MHELLGGSSGTRLTGPAYWTDFDAHFWRTGTSGFWKLERLQVFEEPGDDSWVAFAAGDWDTALQLLEDRRPSLTQYYEQIAQAGFATRRVRVAEEPLTPYMQWELHLLRLRNEVGGGIRVIGPGRVRQYERHGLLPELVTLGDDVMYELNYDRHGLQEGGTRFTDRDLTVRSRELIQELYADGEDVQHYFEHAVAPLGAPAGS